jgi:hypothetical protein
LDRAETTLLKRLTGQLNWAATQTWPDVSFAVVEQSIKYKNPCLGDLVDANKSIKRFKLDSVKVAFPKLTGDLRIVTFSDAAFKNLPDMVSSGRGHILFQMGKGLQCAPLAWTSNKVRRVVGSTLAAEALSLQAAIDHSFYLRAILADMMQVDALSIQIIVYCDSKNLDQAVHSSKLVDDKKLRCDIAMIQESEDKEKVDVRWVPGDRMIADCLTKRGARTAELISVLKTGRMKGYGL